MENAKKVLQDKIQYHIDCANKLLTALNTLSGAKQKIIAITPIRHSGSYTPVIIEFLTNHKGEQPLADIIKYIESISNKKNPSIQGSLSGLLKNKSIVRTRQGYYKLSNSED